MLFLVDNGALLKVQATSAYDAADLALLPAFDELPPKKQPAGSISVYRGLGVQEINRPEGELFDGLTGILLPEAIFTKPESSASEPAA